MAIVRTGTTEYDKEIDRWNTPRNQRVRDHEGNETNVMGMGAIGYEPFPKMLYKAQTHSNGQVLFMDLNAIYATDINIAARAEAFNRSCQLTVNSEDELNKALNQGWRKTPDEAMAYHEGLQRDIAKAAAETNWSVQRMSEKARAEHAAADRATEHPVTDVAAPKRGPKGTRVQVD
jgi:hypothetical protein